MMDHSLAHFGMATNPSACARAGLLALLLVSGSVAWAAEPTAVVANAGMRIEFDRNMRTRVLVPGEGKALALTEFAASEYVVGWNDEVIDQFTLQRHDVTGTQHTLVGVSAQGLEKTVQITLPARQPTLALAQVTYTNRSDSQIKLRKWANHAYTLMPAAGSAPVFWAYQGASFEDRRDWVGPLKPGFEQRNYMGMNASD